MTIGACLRTFAQTVLAVVAAASANAGDTVDLELAGSAKVKGTLRDSAERERFLLVLPTGATVKAAARAKGKFAPAPTLDFVDAGEAVVATGTTKGKGAKLATAPLAQGGSFRVRIAGDGVGDGDYQLKLTPKYRTVFTDSGTSGAISLDGIPFGAPAGATVRIDLRPARGSAFVPSIERIEGPAGFSLEIGGGGRTGPHALGAAGDYFVRFANAGEAGDWTSKVTVAPPKLRAASIDITAGSLAGEFTDGQAVYGRLIGPEGGSLTPFDAGTPIDGTALDVPPGALATPTVLSVSEAAPFFVDSGIHPTGPTVRLSPSPLDFEGDSEIRVTIPFDPLEFSDPAAEMTIYVLDEATGDVEEAAKPYDFSGPAGTVAFFTSHFSSAQTTSSRPRGMVGEWVYLRTTRAVGTNHRGSASFVVGNAFFDANFNWAAFASGAGTTWSNGDGSPFANTIPAVIADGFYEAFDDSFVDVYDQSEDRTTFRRGLSDDVLLSAGTDADDFNAVTLAALFRRPRGRPTQTLIAGTWHLLRMSAGAEQRFDPDGVELIAGSNVGTVAFLPNGDAEFRLSGPQFDAEVDFGPGAWQARSKARAPAASWFVAEGGAFLEIDGEGGSPGGHPVPIRLHPILGGDGLLAVTGGISGSDPQDPALLVFLRTSTAAGADLVEGPDFLAASLQDLLDDAALPVQGLSFAATEAGQDFNAKTGRQPLGGFGVAIGHDAAGSILRNSFEFSGDVPPSPFRITSDGRTSDASGLRGAISRDGSFLALLLADAPTGRSSLTFAIPGPTNR